MPGARIGRYEILEHLASGGMGEVFLAAPVSAAGLGPVIALKVLRSQFAQDQSFIDMLIDEAKISMFLHHKNVVSVLDLIADEETYCIAMEYVAGVNTERLLSALQADGRAIELSSALYIGIELCRGLRHAHECTNDRGEPLNIVHRDVTPANVLLSLEGDVKLTDFGLARAKGRLHHTSAGVLKGRFGYFAPEMTRYETIDARADLFSAGVVLYQLTTGKHPVGHLPPMTAIITFEERRVPPPSTINPAITPALDAIIMRALEPIPDRRWPSAQALGDALHEVAFSTAAWQKELARAPVTLASLVCNVVPGSGQLTMPRSIADDAPTEDMLRPDLEMTEDDRLVTDDIRAFTEDVDAPTLIPGSKRLKFPS